MHDSAMQHLPKVKQVKNAVCVNPHTAANWRGVCLEAHGMREFTNGRRRHGLLLLLLDILGYALPRLTANPLGNVDAGFSGVTGLTGIGDIVAVAIVKNPV